MEQITVLVKDIPGALADICEVLGRKEVNIKQCHTGVEKCGIQILFLRDYNYQDS
jgi:hypothetical protein